MTGPAAASADVPGGERPRVSVVMANHNGRAHLGQAIDSVLGQTLGALELIVSDDASTDGSLALLDERARRDGRLRILTATRNRGPAGARNAALAVARGDWIAIVDNDDWIEPHRLERLLEAGERTGADLVADDLLVFWDDGSRPPAPLLSSAGDGREREIDAATFVEANAPFGSGPALGYLKPMLRRDRLVALGLVYDERLRIGEDYELVVRMLLAGSRYVVVPAAFYHYRKHAGSISHRLSVPTVRAMVDAHEALVRDVRPGGDLALAAALRRRGRALDRALRFERMRADWREGRTAAALGRILLSPDLVWPLRFAVASAVGRRLPRRAGAEAAR